MIAATLRISFIFTTKICPSCQCDQCAMLGSNETYKSNDGQPNRDFASIVSNSFIIFGIFIYVIVSCFYVLKCDGQTNSSANHHCHFPINCEKYLKTKFDH